MGSTLVSVESAHVSVFETNGFPALTGGPQAEGSISRIGTLINQNSDLLRSLAEATANLGSLLCSLQTGSQSSCCGEVAPPAQQDCCHPQGSLSVDCNTITTPGGYKISVNGDCEWTITTPEGKTTKIWGDPHVAEGDGGKWDFHDNSVFVLPDGTKIYATTGDSGNGATVTTGLTVSTGNEHVSVSGVNKGNPEIGQVTSGAFMPSSGFNVNDVFVMGGDGDDWSSWGNGREIIGSEDHGNSLNFGNPLAPVSGQCSGFNEQINLINSLLNSLFGNFRPTNQNQCRRAGQLRNAFLAMGSMLSVVANMMNLALALQAGRNRFRLL